MENRTEDDYNALTLVQLQRIAKNTELTRGWVTFIGVAIIIAAVVQLFGGCLAAVFL